MQAGGKVKHCWPRLGEEAGRVVAWAVPLVPLARVACNSQSIGEVPPSPSLPTQGPGCLQLSIHWFSPTLALLAHAGPQGNHLPHACRVALHRLCDLLGLCPPAVERLLERQHRRSLGSRSARQALSRRAGPRVVYLYR